MEEKRVCVTCSKCPKLESKPGQLWPSPQLTRRGPQLNPATELSASQLVQFWFTTYGEMERV